MRSIAVMGAGGWGIALSKLAFENGCAVKLWEFDKKAAALLQQNREEKRKLPGIRIPDGIEITSDLGFAVAGADLLLWVVPSQSLRKATRAFVQQGIPYNGPHLIAAKGIEVGSLCRMSEVMLQEMPGLALDRIAILSGPSHAEEVGRGLPTSIIAASQNAALAKEIQDLLSGRTFRVYTHSDVMGVELAGSLKNVIAIAAGIADGLGFGDNAKGALLTRGILEIARLGTAMGAETTTFLGLAGVGDLITTCISKHSRNRHVGEQIGKGNKLKDVLSGMVMVAEGVETARSAWALAVKHGVEMPITEQVHKVLFEDKDAASAVDELMLRLPKEEKVQC